jgi:hypothetical protein
MAWMERWPFKPAFGLSGAVRRTLGSFCLAEDVGRCLAARLYAYSAWRNCYGYLVVQQRATHQKTRIVALGFLASGNSFGRDSGTDGTSRLSQHSVPTFCMRHQEHCAITS